MSDTVRAAAAGGVMRAFWRTCALLLAACKPTAETEEACSLDESPYLQEDCLEAMRVACNAHADEASCTATPTWEFDGYGVECAWAVVFEISDPASCTMSTSTRCEAAAIELGGCSDGCAAIPSEQVIIQLCHGPLGPWSSVGSEEEHVGSCGENITPPEPALCACAPAQCDPP